MPFEATTFIPNQTIQSNWVSQWFDCGIQPPAEGYPFLIGVTGVEGNPDTVFKIQISADQVTIYDRWLSSPINTVTNVGGRFASGVRYWRFAATMNTSNPGEGSNNSSSMSGQSFNQSSLSGQSSSSGGTALPTAISFFAGLTPQKQFS